MLYNDSVTTPQMRGKFESGPNMIDFGMPCSQTTSHLQLTQNIHQV